MSYSQPWEPSRVVRPVGPPPIVVPGRPVPPEVRPGAAAGPGDDGWRRTAEVVERLLTRDSDRLRVAVEERSTERLRAVVPLARTLLDDVTEVLEEVRVRSAGTGATAAAPPRPVPAAVALRIARDFPWTDLLERHGRAGDPACVDAARALQEALRGLRPDQVGTAIDGLRPDLRRLRRALAEADRPLSRRRLLRLLSAVLRVVETIAIGVLAAAVTALQQGGPVATAVFAAAIGVAVSASCDRAVRAVRERRAPTPARRLAAAHQRLEDATDDLLWLIEADRRGRAVTDAHAAALALAHQALRLAGSAAPAWSVRYQRAVTGSLLPALDAVGAALRGPDRSTLRSTGPGLEAARAAVAAHRPPAQPVE